MEGRILSHYEILERVGGGGMGVVYRALDTRLGRHVAIKLLPSELTNDTEARQRFVREAQAASALDHPNIGTIYEIGSSEDGQLFIAMALYDGETIKQRVKRGPLPVAEAVDIAKQIALGLAKAHSAGIVHRDIKPANVLLTSDGFVKIVDFGVAKLLGGTRITRAGAVPGTVAFMSPEQLEGDEATPQSDVWALGAVLFEMLTGRLPFVAESEWALMAAITSTEPEAPRTLRPELDASLDRVVLRTLSKKESRYPSADAFLTDLHAIGAPDAIATPAGNERSTSVGRVATAAVLVLVGAGIFRLFPSEEQRWAETEAVAEIRLLVERDDYETAYALAARAERYLGSDPELEELWGEVSRTLSITAGPVEAEVFYTAYADTAGPWKTLGRTPVQGARVPIDDQRVEVRAAGFDLLETVFWRVDPGAVDTTHFDLTPPVAGENMVRVQGGVARNYIGLPAIPALEIGDFALDRYEVTNEEFKAFVSAGGYANTELWEYVSGPDELAGGVTSVEGYVDATGQPGPATWEVGTYPQAERAHPVGGVSWHEAAAYCRWRGKELPSVYHWAWASAMPAEGVPMSNLLSDRLLPVGQRPAHAESGAYDMAGNLKEWVHNRVGDGRLLMGGSYVDAQHQFNEPDQRQASDRSPFNGFRCMTLLQSEAVPDFVYAPISRQSRDFREERPVSDEVFEAYRGQFAYDPIPLAAEVEVVDERTPLWRKEKITYAAPYDGERATAYLWIPTNASPPYQTVVLFPGSTDIVMESSDHLSRYATIIEFLPLSGRAVLYPIYKGTYERNDGSLSWSQPDMSANYKDHLIKWVQDFSRGVDYLETRSDIDETKLAYLGYSWGGTMGAIIPALEPRLRASVLALAGFWLDPALPEVDQINYVSRVTIPTIMLTGAEDFLFPYETSQLPMYELLGTPADQKRLIAYEGASHDLYPIKRNQLIQETLGWLDRYLGPVRFR